MGRPRALPLERKLTLAILSTSGLALLVTCVGIIAYETATFRQRVLDDLTASARLIAANSVAALTFKDPEAAQEYLGTLGTQPLIVSSVIYSGQGAIFAAYLRADRPPRPLPARPGVDGHRFEAGKLFLTQPILFGGERLGTIYIESDLGPWKARIARYAGIVAVVLLSLVVVALVLEAALRPLVSKPIGDLARVAQGVVERKDYSARAVKRSEDEIGRLIDVFNQMLSAVEERDAALQKARDELEERVEERTAEVLDLYNRAPCGYHSLDKDGVFVNVNDTELAWLGYSREEVIGKKRLADFLTPESRAVFHEEFPRFKERGFASDVELDLVRKDGRILRALINATAIKDEAGQFLKSRSTLVDITARKRAEDEIRRLNVELERRVEERTAELRRSVEELEQFAYVASHDLQEPLRMVSSFVQLLAERYGDRLDDDGHDFIRFAVEGATRMHDLINALLAYSRLDTAATPFAPVSCEEALDGALENLQVAIQESRAVVTRGPLPRVPGDRTQIVQLFQNLVGNAIKFRREEEPPRVRVEAELAGEEWRFSVRDNGIGIEPRHAERVFVIFQRLHGRSDYPGTGIGLAICKKIVERHRGVIWVESALEEGSVFRFTLPKAAGEARA